MTRSEICSMPLEAWTIFMVQGLSRYTTWYCWQWEVVPLPPKVFRVSNLRLCSHVVSQGKGEFCARSSQAAPPLPIDMLCHAMLREQSWQYTHQKAHARSTSPRRTNHYAIIAVCCAVTQANHGKSSTQRRLWKVDKDQCSWVVVLAMRLPTSITMHHIHVCSDRDNWKKIWTVLEPERGQLLAKRSHISTLHKHVNWR